MEFMEFIVIAGKIVLSLSFVGIVVLGVAGIRHSMDVNDPNRHPGVTMSGERRYLPKNF